jgi:hypothetical protein
MPSVRSAFRDEALLSPSPTASPPSRPSGADVALEDATLTVTPNEFTATPSKVPVRSNVTGRGPRRAALVAVGGGLTLLALVALVQSIVRSSHAPAASTTTDAGASPPREAVSPAPRTLTTSSQGRPGAAPGVASAQPAIELTPFEAPLDHETPPRASAHPRAQPARGPI